VEDSEEAKFCAEMLGIGGDRAQGFGGGDTAIRGPRAKIP
jgi:hypothetical protein